MITVKSLGNQMFKISGQFEGRLPTTFTFENVDISGATISPEQAMATIAQWPMVQRMGEYQLRQSWKNLVEQAAIKVVESIK